jgi:hypothetical protein
MLRSEPRWELRLKQAQLPRGILPAMPLPAEPIGSIPRPSELIRITDGEQTKPSFATYPIHGSDHLAPHGVQIPF